MFHKLYMDVVCHSLFLADIFFYLIGSLLTTFFLIGSLLLKRDVHLYVCDTNNEMVNKVNHFKYPTNYSFKCFLFCCPFIFTCITF